MWNYSNNKFSIAFGFKACIKLIWERTLDKKSSSTSCQWNSRTSSWAGNVSFRRIGKVVPFQWNSLQSVIKLYNCPLNIRLKQNQYFSMNFKTYMDSGYGACYRFNPSNHSGFYTYQSGNLFGLRLMLTVSVESVRIIP